MNKIITIVAGVLIVGLALIGALYAFDVGVGATITDKQCLQAGGSTVDVKSDFFGAGATLEVPFQQCGAIQKGNYVKFHIRSERSEIYESKGGACIYDTENGPNGCGN